MFYQTNSTVNITKPTEARVPLIVPSVSCSRIKNEEYFWHATLACTIFNLFICPVTIVMNVLVIAAVKTRPRLQNECNILLACLAATDLFVGTLTLPTFIAAGTYALAGGSTYCTTWSMVTGLVMFLPILASLFHLVLISVERLIAMKFALRYNHFVTKSRLWKAVAFCWLLAGLYTTFTVLVPAYSGLLSFALLCLFVISLFIIVYSHTTVYFVVRRHFKQIRTEHIPGGEVSTFVEEAKACKTTGIIIGFVFLSFLPGALFTVAVLISGVHHPWFSIFLPVVHSSLMLTSLCNPIIYCFRNQQLRQAMFTIIKGKRTENSLVCGT